MDTNTLAFVALASSVVVIVASAARVLRAGRSDVADGD